MDYRSLTRKELQTLCKKNKIRANMTNLAMAHALSSLPTTSGIDFCFWRSRSQKCFSWENPIDRGQWPKHWDMVWARLEEREPLDDPTVEFSGEFKVHGVAGSGDSTPETPLLTGRKRKATPSDIISPKATRTCCLEKATGSLALETKEDSNVKQKVVYVVNHTHGTRLSDRLKQKSQLKIAESAQKVRGRYDAIGIEMLRGDEKDEAVGTKCEVTDDVFQNNEGNKVKVSNAELDDVVSGNVSSNMLYAEYLKLAKSGDPGELTVHLYGDQDATIEETSGGVSRDKIACALNGCSSEVSFAPMVSAAKSWNVARTLVGCTSEISCAPIISAKKSRKVARVLNESSLMGKETATIKLPNEDQNMESEDRPIDLNVPYLMVEKAEDLEASHVDDEESKLMCEAELRDVKVTEDEEYNEEDGSNVNDAISDAVEKFLFSPSIIGPISNQSRVHVSSPTRTATSENKVRRTTPLMSSTKKKAFTTPISAAKKTMNITGALVETKYVDESSLMAGKAENLEDSNVDYGKSKLACEVGIYNVKVTEVEENNTEDGSNANDETSHVRKFSFSPSVTDSIAAQILVHDATPTRTTARCNSYQKQNKGENTSRGKLTSTSMRQLKKTIKQRTYSENKNTIIETNKEVRSEEHENKGENTLQRKLKATSLRQLKKMIKQLADNKNTIVKLNKEVVPEDDVNEDENTAQKELKATSARQLKKMIKRRIQTTRRPLS